LYKQLLRSAERGGELILGTSENRKERHNWG